MNKFIQWSNEDVVYVGEVIDETDTLVTFKTKYGEFTIPKDDGTFKSISLAEFQHINKQIQILHQSFEPVSQTGSKKSEAIIIFNRMIGATRKNIIATFKAELGMSDACASTYYQNIKHSLK